jgi:nitrite reductase/ring-hydroxylating ferredoxin subunit
MPAINVYTFVFVLLFWATAHAYAPTGFMTRRSTMTMKRGRGSFNKEIGGGSMPSSPSSSSGGGLSGGVNWIQTKNKVQDLPQEEGKIGLIETGAFLLVDKATNPNGAVSVVKYGPETYCFSVNCPKCKIPMMKAKTLPPNDETQNKAPRIACDFCKSTFNLKTGAPLQAQEAAGILGSIAKAVMSAQDATPLPVYTLAEKNGKVLFSME